MSRSSQPGAGQDPARFDPWSGHHFGGAGFLAASSVVHLGVLVVLATLSIAAVKTVEKIRVKIIDEVGIEEFDGAPSLEDYVGLLDVAPAPRRQAARPRGPAVRNVQAALIPRLGGVGPKLGRGPKVDVRRASLSLGSGAIGGLGGSFGDYVGGLRKVGLDLALVIDTTESMQFVIDEVKARTTFLVESIQRMVPTSRVGIVVYRDQGDEYVVKWTDLSFRTAKLRGFVANIFAAGGGDWEEAVLEGLETAVNDLSWRKRSKRIIILVGGSPPHPEDLETLLNLVSDFRASGGYLSAVDVTDRLHLEFSRELWRSLYGKKPFEPPQKPEYYKQVTAVYGHLANTGGGELVGLVDDKKLIRDVLVLTFGSRWKVEMAKYMKELSS